MERFIRTVKTIKKLVSVIQEDGISVTPLLLFSKDVADLVKMKYCGSLIGLAVVVIGILLVVVKLITEVNFWMNTCSIL